jgi:hypothetical protein
MTIAAQDKNRRRIESCSRDCAAARAAVRAARDILEDTEPDTRWYIEAWALPAPKGEIRLTLGGNMPWGRVPAGFRRKWLLALADAALGEVGLINEQEQL